MTGRGTSPGDPDLYVRFKNLPTVSSREWDCRPYLDGPAEACSLDVPADATQAYVMVRGYEVGRYDLAVSYTPNTP